MYNANTYLECDGRRTGLKQAFLIHPPLDMEHDNNRDHRDIEKALNIQHNQNHIFTYATQSPYID